MRDRGQLRASDERERGAGALDIVLGREPGTGKAQQQGHAGSATSRGSNRRAAVESNGGELTWPRGGSTVRLRMRVSVCLEMWSGVRRRGSPWLSWRGWRAGADSRLRRASRRRVPPPQTRPQTSSARLCLCLCLPSHSLDSALLPPG